jgi:hypothetical protein
LLDATVEAPQAAESLLKVSVRLSTNFQCLAVLPPSLPACSAIDDGAREQGSRSRSSAMADSISMQEAQTETRASELPDRWLCEHSALGLDCAAIRIKAMQLTQLRHQDGAKAVACHDFVRAISFELSNRRAHTASQVLSAGRGTALEKGNLLVALLRCSEIPARLRMYALAGDHLRGLVSWQCVVLHPVVEAFVAQRWVGTDTFHLDVSLALAGRRRLLREGQRCGWGVNLDGDAAWDCARDAFAVFDWRKPAAQAAFDWGVFHDSDDFARVAATLTGALKPSATPMRNWVESWVIGRMRLDGDSAVRPGLGRV